MYGNVRLTRLCLSILPFLAVDPIVNVLTTLSILPLSLAVFSSLPAITVRVNFPLPQSSWPGVRAAGLDCNLDPTLLLPVAAR